MKTRILMMAVLMGLTTFLFAQSNDKKQGKAPHGLNPEMQMKNPVARENGMNLTDAQRDAFKQSMIAMQKQLQPLRNEMGEAVAHQKTLTTVDKPDMAAVNKNLEKIGDIKTEMAKVQTKYHLEMRAQLSDEQRLKFDMFKHQRMDGRGQRSAKFHGEKPMR